MIILSVDLRLGYLRSFKMLLGMSTLK